MRYAIGLDIGGTKIRSALGNEKGELSEFLSEETDSMRIEEQIYRMLDSYSRYDCIGIGSMGPLNSEKGIITNPPNTKAKIRNLKIVSLLEKRYKVRCKLLNDCIAGVYGEKAFGAGKGVKSLAYVTFSTGVGSGVIDNNRIITGKDGNGQEVGHCGVDADIRMACRCGCLGRHWAAYSAGISMPGFIKQMLLTKYRGRKSKLSARRSITPKEFFDIASNDEVGSELLEDLGRINASGISNIVNAFDPELITIGGSIALNNQEEILDPIKRYVKDYSINRVPKIMMTPLKGDIILAGAIAFILDATKM